MNEPEKKDKEHGMKKQANIFVTSLFELIQQKRPLVEIALWLRQFRVREESK